MTTPTPAEIARAKRCRHFLNWEEYKNGRVSVSSKVSWLVFSGSFATAKCADTMFAITLRPIFASVGPVLFEEAANVAKKSKNGYVCSYHDAREDGIGSSGYDDACDDIERAIKALSARASADEMEDRT